jgi:hypothetical protein
MGSVLLIEETVSEDLKAAQFDGKRDSLAAKPANSPEFVSKTMETERESELRPESYRALSPWIPLGEFHHYIFAILIG